MTREERLNAQKERLHDLDDLLKRPPFDHTKPIQLPQHVIETMARTLVECVRREIEEKKGDDGLAKDEAFCTTIEES